MRQLESLETIAALRFFADHVQHGIYELGALCVMSLGPVVTGARLAEDEVVGAEDLSERTGADRVHGAGFQIDEHCPGNVFAAWK